MGSRGGRCAMIGSGHWWLRQKSPEPYTGIQGLAMIASVVISEHVTGSSGKNEGHECFNRKAYASYKCDIECKLE